MKSILFRTTLIAAAAALLSTAAFAQTGAKLKVGLMLPYTGTYASLGNAIENGFKLYLTEQGGSFGATWAPPITLVIAVGLQWVLLAATSEKSWVMKRGHDPRTEVKDPWEARVRCHVCDRSYIAIEMDRDPSHDHKAICAGCASESTTFYHAAHEEALRA